jgi:hypothetical protein
MLLTLTVSLSDIAVYLIFNFLSCNHFYLNNFFISFILYFSHGVLFILFTYLIEAVRGGIEHENKGTSDLFPKSY